MKRYNIINFPIKCALLLAFWGIFLTQTVAQTASCGAGPGVSGILAKWNFDNSTPVFYQGSNTYTPDINAGCGTSRLGSPGHANTAEFTNAICLLNFYNPTLAQQSYGGVSYDPNSTTFDPEGKANLTINYTFPAGREACLSSFSLQILQKQFNGTTVNFEKQGVAVKRNGVLIYNSTQTITAANINATPMTFNFTGQDFCSDGLQDVTYTIIFGLVHRLVPEASYDSPAATGYDDLIVNGTCGGPAGYAKVYPSGCNASGSANNGSIFLVNYDPSVHFDYTIGATYTGSKTYATATAMPLSGLVTNTLPNPSAPQTYTVRIFDASGCAVDKTVTLPVNNCPTVPCNEPSGMLFTVTNATCSGATSNNNGSIQVTNVTGGDKVAISTTGTGFDYATANALSGGAYTFTNLSNPTGAQIYTIRIYNGSGCYTDRTVVLEETPCGPCSNGLVEVIAADIADSDSQVNNGATEDDKTTFQSCKGTSTIDLSLTKTVNTTTGTVGTTTFTYTLSLTNEGTMTATDIQVADPIPAGLQLTNAVPSTGIFGANTGWLINSLAAGQTVTLTVSVIALKAGTYTNCAYVNTALPNNDSDSTPGNSYTANEDDDACANAITVTGSTPPSIAKEFSPMNVVPGKSIRLIFKITNNESTSITLSSNFVDNLPSSPAQMVVASNPNIQSTLSGVVATAGGTTITIPSGTVLPPGLSQVYVDVTVPSNGWYCNNIAAGALVTSAGANILATNACIAANTAFCMPPVISLSFPKLIVGIPSNLTITIDNRNTGNLTLEQKALFTLPSNLKLATGSNTGTLAVAPFAAGDSSLTVNTGVVLAPGLNTIIVPIEQTVAGVVDFCIPMNTVLTTGCGGITNIGNEDVAKQLTPYTCTPPSGITLTQTAPTCTGATANNDGKITLTTVTNADKYGIVTGATYTGGVAYAAATTVTPSVIVQNSIPNTGGTYTIRFFNGSDTCYTDQTVTVAAVTCSAPCPNPNCGTVTVVKN
jgi:uncharacterized repeat protein (TIGR01451 family)